MFSFIIVKIVGPYLMLGSKFTVSNALFIYIYIYIKHVCIYIYMCVHVCVCLCIHTTVSPEILLGFNLTIRLNLKKKKIRNIVIKDIQVAIANRELYYWKIHSSHYWKQPCDLVCQHLRKKLWRKYV